MPEIKNISVTRFLARIAEVKKVRKGLDDSPRIDCTIGVEKKAGSGELEYRDVTLVFPKNHYEEFQSKLFELPEQKTLEDYA
jgi:hypothetical protein